MFSFGLYRSGHFFEQDPRHGIIQALVGFVLAKECPHVLFTVLVVADDPTVMNPDTQSRVVEQLQLAALTPFLGISWRVQVGRLSRLQSPAHASAHNEGPRARRFLGRFRVVLSKVDPELYLVHKK